MGMCKKCNGVFGAREMENGVCKNCITSISESTTMINIPKSYLTEEERAKIIEEEELRNEIRMKSKNSNAEDIGNTVGEVFAGIFLVGVILYIGTLLYLNL